VNDYTEPVREYLTYCRKSAAQLKAAGSALDPKYHPTADGAAKMIPHDGDAGRAKAIRQAFRELTATPPPGTPSRQTTETNLGDR
jgi:hypothetical protein